MIASVDVHEEKKGREEMRKRRILWTKFHFAGMSLNQVKGWRKKKRKKKLMEGNEEKRNVYYLQY